MRYLCLLAGEPDMETPVPGTPEFMQIEFMQMLSDYESANCAGSGRGRPRQLVGGPKTSVR